MAKKKKSPPKKIKAIVLDGSAALAWCFSDEANPYADAIARKLPDLGAVVPAIWHLEIANALLVGERRGRCDQADTSKWTTFLSSLSIIVDEHNGGRVFSDVLALARAHNLSTYDASYLELCLRLGLPLATLDKPLKAAATSVGVVLFDPQI
jgi:predicted nucleic acid-binding protein